MIIWMAISAIVCALCGALVADPLGLIATTGQSYLLLLMALAGTVLFGAFDAYESQGPRRERDDS